VAAVFLFVTGPRGPAVTSPADVAASDRTVRGAFHIHTTRSDGALDKAAVAAAAARAGLQFAIFTDHGDGMAAPDPPAYLSGVLCIDGVEISTNQGHYLAIGMPAAPYPLGGDARTVVEDVRRLGGFGVVAHPSSLRDQLSWSEWSEPVDGIEWLNGDSEWRDEGRVRLSRALIDYLWRPAGALASMLDRPVETLRRWDAINRGRAVVGLAGNDAHGGMGSEYGGTAGRRLHVPSYEASFRTFSIHATLPAPTGGNSEEDARAILQAIRSGNVFTAVTALAAPAALSFTGTTADGRTSLPGGILQGGSPARFRVRARVPSGSTTVLMRDGSPISEAGGGVLDVAATQPGVYRVEIRVSDAPGTPPVPWLVSNAIRLGLPTHEIPGATETPRVVDSLVDAVWRTERDPGSTASVIATPEWVTLTYRLREGNRASQYAALVVDLEGVPPEADGVMFRGRATGPMRVSTQLRFVDDEGKRWGSSVYLSSDEREVRVPFRGMRSMERAPGSDSASTSVPPPLPPIVRASSLLFVVDLTNALPGAQGSFSISHVAVTGRP
jgi:hypothetical protein